MAAVLKSIRRKVKCFSKRWVWARHGPSGREKVFPEARFGELKPWCLWNVGAQVQPTPDGWVWRQHQGTAYSMFLRPLVSPGNLQLAKWVLHVHVATPAFVSLALSRCPRFVSATSYWESPLGCLTSQHSHLGKCWSFGKLLSAPGFAPWLAVAL